jgi:hypothetical protein
VNNQRSFFGFVVASVITVLVVAGIGFYWFFGKSTVKLGTPISQPGAAIFVSKVAPAMVSFLVNPAGLQSLEQQGEFSQLQNNLFAQTRIDFSNDIQPWLGNEVTLAVTSEDIDHNSTNGLQPGYLLALATKDAVKSKEFVEVFFSQRTLSGKELEVNDYKGVKLFYDQAKLETSVNSENSLTAAIVNDFVLFGNDPHVVRSAINNVQVPNLNLQSSPEYEKAIQELPKNALGLAFFNLEQVGKWQGLELTKSIYDSQILSFVVKPQGLLTESSFLTTSELTPVSQPLKKPVGALKYIPETASIAIASTNLNNLHNSDLGQLWEQVTTTIYGSQEEAITHWLKPVEEIKKTKGLNLSEDIFSWVTGEYALGIFPNLKSNPENKHESKNFDWMFVVEKSPQLKEGITRLDQIAKNNGFNVSNITLNEQQITAWTELIASSELAKVKVEAKIKGVHTNLDNYEIFTSDLETMEKIVTHQEKSLLENAQFKQNIASIPQPNQGYLYIDWEKSQNFLERQQPLLKFVEVLGKPLFDHLRSLTVSKYGEETGILKGGIFFQLKP